METNVKAVELKELWRRYKEDGDERARERLVVAYSPLVKYVAGRMASGLPSHVEEADLISYGLIGLIGAIERFDLEREIKFETYAVSRIKGAIIDELRSLDWVPRSVRARAREVEQAHSEARAQAAAARRPTRRWPTSSSISVDDFQDDAARDRELLGARARRPLDGRPTPRAAARSRCSTRSRTRTRSIPRRRSTRVRAQGPPRRRDRVAARARAARDRPLLLREPDPARDRRGPRRDRVARLAAPHQGRARPALAGSRL